MDNGGLLSKVFFDWLFVLEVFFGERVFDLFWNGIVFERLLSINEFLKYELRFVSFKLGFVEVFIVVFILLYVLFFVMVEVGFILRLFVVCFLLVLLDVFV